MFKTAKDAREYTLAGKATITLTSQKTQAHYTYRIRSSKDGHCSFVQVLVGPDNTTDYQYLGIIPQDRYGAPQFFRCTQKSRFYKVDLAAEAPCLKAFRYYWDHVLANRLPANLEVRHEGSCGRCGRVLTTPESIDRGIGPECWEKMGGL